MFSVLNVGLVCLILLGFVLKGPYDDLALFQHLLHVLYYRVPLAVERACLRLRNYYSKPETYSVARTFYF